MYPTPFLFFDISGGELLIILAVLFLVFGPKKIPDIARKLGRTMNALRQASYDITREIQDEDVKEQMNRAQEEIREVVQGKNTNSAPEKPTASPGGGTGNSKNGPTSGAQQQADTENTAPPTDAD